MNKLKRQATHVHYTYKTKDDFLRWWREQDARKKQAAEEQITQDDRAISRALMVWADDGGLQHGLHDPSTDVKGEPNDQDSIKREKKS